MVPEYLLAFDFGGTKLAIAAATPDGRILSRAQVATAECRDAADALRRAIAAGQGLARAAEAEGKRLAGIGIATMGITRRDGVDMAPNVPGWHALRLWDAFGEAFPGTPVAIANDVKAAALAEVRSGALQDTRSGMYVNLGTGIAVALTMGDQVLEGSHGAAGEIGYNLRRPDESHGVRDGVAPLEEYTGGKALGERATRRFGRSLTAADVFALVAEDPEVRAFVDDAMTELAFHLANAMVLWDPEVVAFGGGVMGAQDVILPVIERYVRRFVPFPPRLTLAFYRRDAGLHGALELARQAMAQENTKQGGDSLVIHP
ncbi:MAG: ROK family protein [Alicyclobacillus macrosporangiidus]|uniref:ROK family protein n=1 Tax=Alicyclobacillus macrosporangiidus TaxID=392015 RepID=UPI0026EAE639|nr:ROK family protein [Alicyclobacillus macrosporangiidus]MCL6600360.1 ROK family protein [Alicyclobacillus macrosporangiidus]